MDGKYPSAPELPGKPSSHKAADETLAAEPTEITAPSSKIQLIQSTQPKQTDEEPREALLDDEEEVVTLEDEDELDEHVREPGDPDGVAAQDQIHKWQQTHPLPVTEPRKRKPLWLKALLTLLIIAALAAAAWWFGNKKAEAPTAKAGTTVSQTTKPVKQAVIATKHYVSTNFTLEFDYPDSWTVDDTTSKLTMTSPSQKFTSTTGQTVEGHAVLTFQNPQTTIPGYPAQGAVAALASDKLTYKKPTQIQRAQTYVSYLSYSANSLDALFVTGDNGYQVGQQVPMSDVVKGNPLVGVAFMSCGTTGCSAGGTALSLRPSGWTGSQAAKDITALIESLQLD
jgi:hypothetical protein